MVLIVTQWLILAISICLSVTLIGLSITYISCKLGNGKVGFCSKSLTTSNPSPSSSLPPNPSPKPVSTPTPTPVSTPTPTPVSTPVSTPTPKPVSTPVSTPKPVSTPVSTPKPVSTPVSTPTSDDSSGIPITTEKWQPAYFISGYYDKTND